MSVAHISSRKSIAARERLLAATNLIKQCWGAAIMLLTKGVMVRGYITRGTIHHQGMEFLGSGYHTAYGKERSVTAFKREADEKGTPFVEIDPSVCSYVRGLEDRCVQEMFDRFTRTEEGVTGLFPFKVLSHSFMIGGLNPFDPAKEKQSNDNLSPEPDEDETAGCEACRCRERERGSEGTTLRGGAGCADRTMR